MSFPDPISEIRNKERSKETSFKNYLRAELICHGLNEEDSDKIIQEMIKKDTIMFDRWNDDPDGYPEMMFNVLWYTLKTDALEYINTNCPNAWFKPMFE